jgi:DNA-binding NtrC family response regulator
VKTLLFADDNKNIREFCRQELADEGYRVILARDGRDAVRLVQEEHPDLAILDICMPSTGGLEALERIKAVDPAIPIIFFTANDEDCVTDSRSRFAIACVEKSEDLGELKRTVVRLLSSREVNDVFRSGLPPRMPDAGDWPTTMEGAQAQSR